MSTSVDAVPLPITPGAEMAVLLRFHRDCTGTGTIAEGVVGPATPAMTAEGRGYHELIQDGRWIVGHYSQEQYLSDRTFVLSWHLHWVAGWDPALREYRATVADCYGHAEVLRGGIDGDRLVFESTGDPPVRIRLVWDATRIRRVDLAQRGVRRRCVLETHRGIPLSAGRAVTQWPEIPMRRASAR